MRRGWPDSAPGRLTTLFGDGPGYAARHAARDSVPALRPGHRPQGRGLARRAPHRARGRTARARPVVLGSAGAGPPPAGQGGAGGGGSRPDLHGDHRIAPEAGARESAVEDPRLRRHRIHHPGLLQGARAAPGAPKPHGRRPRGQRQGRAGPLRHGVADRPSRLSAPRRARGRGSGGRGDLSGHRRPAVARRAPVRPGSPGARAGPRRMAGRGLAGAPAVAVLAGRAQPPARIPAPKPTSRPARPHRRRLAFDELLAHQLALAQRKAAAAPEPPPIIPASDLADRARAALPFRLTGAQLRGAGRDPRRPRLGRTDDPADPGRRRGRQDRGGPAGHGRCAPPAGSPP